MKRDCHEGGVGCPRFLYLSLSLNLAIKHQSPAALCSSQLTPTSDPHLPQDACYYRSLIIRFHVEARYQYVSHLSILRIRSSYLPLDLCGSNLQYIQPHAPQYMIDRYRKACVTWQDTKSLVQAYLVRPFPFPFPSPFNSHITLEAHRCSLETGGSCEKLRPTSTQGNGTYTVCINGNSKTRSDNHNYRSHERQAYAGSTRPRHINHYSQQITRLH